MTGPMTVAAGNQVAQGLIKKIGDAFGDIGSAWIAEHRAKNCYQNLYKNLSLIRKVKTFLNTDKALDLYQFYVDANVNYNGNLKAYRGIEDFQTGKKFVVQGIAGQGKSIFLRFLASQDLIKGERFPVFFELRKLESGKTLMDGLIASCGTYGIKIDDVKLKILLEKGLVSLFLDGFDEVDSTLKPQVISYIEALSTRYDGVYIFVSSRPEAGIENSAFFEILKISDLNESDYKSIIKKALPSELAKSMIKTLEGSSSSVQGLLTTPLMVVLLMITYRSVQKIPDQLSEFYDDLFGMLLIRHDGIKMYERKKKCRISNRQYRDLFECFCILSKSNTNNVFDKNELIEYAEKAVSVSGLTVDGEAFVDDIINVTCLVIRDGMEYKFIHKSIQEFYAASFIAHQGDQTAAPLYEKIASDSDFRQEVIYLADIDRIRYLSLLKIPYMERLFALNVSSIAASSVDQLCSSAFIGRLFGNDRIYFRHSGSDVNPTMLTFRPIEGQSVENHMIHFGNRHISDVFSIHYNASKINFEADEAGAELGPNLVDENDPDREAKSMPGIKVTSLLSIPEYFNKFKKISESVISQCIEEAKEHLILQGNLIRKKDLYGLIHGGRKTAGNPD